MTSSMPIATRFFLTGRPGIGKTTVIRRILETIAREHVVGFTSAELLVNGKRAGFSVCTLSGSSGLLASPDTAGEPRFGSMMPDGRRRLGVSLGFLEDVACPELRGAPAERQVLRVIDEIGPMQACSAVFRTTVQDIIASGVPVIASIAESDDAWIAGIRLAEQRHLITLSRANRDAVPDIVASALRADGIIPPTPGAA